jgi:hypothetical protein
MRWYLSSQYSLQCAQLKILIGSDAQLLMFVVVCYKKETNKMNCRNQTLLHFFIANFA